jgi:origin recognition complex subunit 3
VFHQNSQIAHIKHFEEPLTILAHDELLGGATSAEAIELLSQPSSFEFLDALLMRVLSFTNTSSGFTPDLANLTIPRVLGLVAEARTQFQHRLLGMQRAYNCLRLLQTWLASQGYKASLNSSVGGVVPPALGVMYDILIGRVDKEMKYLGTAVS